MACHAEGRIRREGRHDGVDVALPPLFVDRTHQCLDITTIGHENSSKSARSRRCRIILARSGLTASPRDEHGTDIPLRLASRIADRVIFLAAGVMAETGTASEIFGSPRQERTRQFISSLTHG